jgi:hypothetical protein
MWRSVLIYTGRMEMFDVFGGCVWSR